MSKLISVLQVLINTYSLDLPQVWECTDQENGIVCRFRWHQFNETQQVKVADGQTEPDAMAMAKAMREMGDWLAENHKDVVF